MQDSFKFERFIQQHKLSGLDEKERDFLNEVQEHINNSDLEKAIAMISLRKGPYTKEYSFLIGLFYHMEYDDSVTAISWLQNASELDCAKNKLAHIFWSNEYYEDAKYWFEECIKNNYPQAAENYKIMTTYFQNKMEDDDYFEEEIYSEEEEEEDDHNSYSCAEGYCENLSSELSKFEEKSSSSVCNTLHLAKIYGLFGNYKESISYFNKAANDFNDNYSKNVINIFSLKQEEKSENECCVCNETENICVLNCKHYLCYTCLCKINVSSKRKCPICRNEFFKIEK